MQQVEDVRVLGSDGAATTGARHTSPEIFDRDLLRRRRNRAARRAVADTPDFLLSWVAEDIADRLSVVKRSFPNALNLGAHTGGLGRVLRQLPGVESVLDADMSAEMLKACDGPSVLVDEEALPFADGTFDLVVSGLSLQHVNDLPGALIQIRRCLKPDGLFIGALLGGATLHELRSALTEAESEISGGVSPRVAPFADVRDLGALLQRAGFALPVTDADTLTVTYETAFALMRDLRGMGATNVLVERRRVPSTRALFLRAAEIYQQRFAEPDGRVRATFEIVTLTAWAPDESQPRPLKPGSAKVRLADALGTAEQPAGDKTGPKS